MNAKASILAGGLLLAAAGSDLGALHYGGPEQPQSHATVDQPGHSQQCDFTSAFRVDPWHALEPGKDWIWYKPR